MAPIFLGGSQPSGSLAFSFLAFGGSFHLNPPEVRHFWRSENGAAVGFGARDVRQLLVAFAGFAQDVFSRRVERRGGSESGFLVPQMAESHGGSNFLEGKVICEIDGRVLGGMQFGVLFFASDGRVLWKSGFARVTAGC